MMRNFIDMIIENGAPLSEQDKKRILGIALGLYHKQIESNLGSMYDGSLSGYMRRDDEAHDRIELDKVQTLARELGLEIAQDDPFRGLDPEEDADLIDQIIQSRKSQ